MDLNQSPIVPVDSSAARIPNPGLTIAFAVAINSSLKGFPDSILIDF